mgnify:CR=1 FL=1
MNAQIKQMLDSDAWKKVEEIIERTKTNYLNADVETGNEKRIAYQTLRDLKAELENEIDN